MALGNYGRLPFGSDPLLQTIALNNGLVGASAPLTALNNGVAIRFTATDNRDVKAVQVYWQSIPAAPSTAPQVTVRIETIDATSGKPTGTLYDANAVMTGQTIGATGWASYQFAATPTTHLTPGNEYAVVILDTTGTVGGTGTLTLGYLNSYGCLPAAILAAGDGTTRSNFAELSAVLPACTLTLTDGTTDVEEAMGFCPYGTLDSTNYQAYGTRAWGVKFAVPAGETWAIRGFEVDYMLRTGTPASDLRARILNASDALTDANATATISRNSLLNVTGRRLRRNFPAAISLAAGTYRLALDFADHSQVSSSNYFSTKLAVIRPGSALALPAGYGPTYTADVTATPVVWTDDGTTKATPISLIFDDSTSSGGGIVQLVGRGLVI